MQLHYSPSYVLDEMQMYEVRAAMKYQHLAFRDGWEQARLIAFLIAQCNSTKQLKPSDIMKFQWDKEEAENTSISNTDLQRLKEKAQNYIKNNLI